MKHDKLKHGSPIGRILLLSHFIYLVCTSCTTVTVNKIYKINFPAHVIDSLGNIQDDEPKLKK